MSLQGSVKSGSQVTGASLEKTALQSPWKLAAPLQEALLQRRMDQTLSESGYHLSFQPQSLPFVKESENQRTRGYLKR